VPHLQLAALPMDRPHPDLGAQVLDNANGVHNSPHCLLMAHLCPSLSFTQEERYDDEHRLREDCEDADC
jgi:hypothetical protein